MPNNEEFRKIDLYGDEDGTIDPICDCGATLPLPTNVEVNLADLVEAALAHECRVV
jgi:hypothetical protein